MTAARHRKPVALAACVVFALTACSVATDESTEAATVQIMVDYPMYDRQSLIEEASLIVEGTALTSEFVRVKSRHVAGDTPEEDPYFGLSEDERAKALEQDEGTPSTAVTFRIDVVHKGNVEPGQEVTIMQPGGVNAALTHKVEASPPLADGESYLLFGADSFDGAFFIVGGSAGMFRPSGAGTYTAVNSESAPFAQLTTAELRSFIE